MGESIMTDFNDLHEKLDRIEAKLNEINKLLSGVMDEIDGEDRNKNTNTPSNQSSTYRSGFNLFVTP